MHPRVRGAQHIGHHAGHVSAGKRHSTRIRNATPWLKTTLIQAAWAGARKKDSYLHAQFVRLKSRRGPKKAIVAVAASMLTAAYSARLSTRSIESR